MTITQTGSTLIGEATIAEFAAGLMGVPVEEVKPFVRPAGARRAGEGRSVETARGAVVVERKVRRFARP